MQINNDNNVDSKFHLVPSKKENELTISTINVQTLSNDIKLANVCDIFTSLRHDIGLLQESRRTGQGMIEIDALRFIWIGHKKKKLHGVSIILAPHVKLLDIFYISPRILKLHIKVHGINFAIVNCYSPTEQSKDSMKDTFYKDLQKCLDDIPSIYKPILGGDFNATIGNNSYGSWNCLGPTNHGEPDTNNNGNRLLSFAERNTLRLENTIRPSKPRLIKTWVSGTGFEKRLDYFLTSSIMKKYVTKCRCRRGSSLLYVTDHYLLEMALYLPTKKELKTSRRINQISKKQPNIATITDPNVNSVYVQNLKNSLIKNHRHNN